MQQQEFWSYFSEAQSNKDTAFIWFSVLEFQTIVFSLNKLQIILKCLSWKRFAIYY